jgi:hypothetical protein
MSQMTQIAQRGYPEITQMSPESKTASPLPEPDPILVSSRAAFTGGCQELGDLRTEAAERNNVAKTTILHACRDRMNHRDHWAHSDG